MQVIHAIINDNIAKGKSEGKKRNQRKGMMKNREETPRVPNPIIPDTGITIQKSTAA